MRPVRFQLASSAQLTVAARVEGNGQRSVELTASLRGDLGFTPAGRVAEECAEVGGELLVVLEQEPVRGRKLRISSSHG
jgi:hypothetical protein